MTTLITPQLTETLGPVYCPICTHTVVATIQSARKISRAKPGQRCPRCKSSLDAGYVIRMPKAA